MIDASLGPFGPYGEPRSGRHPRFGGEWCDLGPACPEINEHIMWDRYQADPEAPCINCGHPWCPEAIDPVTHRFTGPGHLDKQTAAVHCNATVRTPMGSCMCEQVRPMSVSCHVIFARLGMACDLPADPMAVGGGIFELLNGPWAVDFFADRYGLNS